MDKRKEGAGVIKAVAACAVSLGIYKAAGVLLSPLFRDDYLAAFVYQLIFAAAAAVFVWLISKNTIYRSSPALLRAGWPSAALFIAVFAISIVRAVSVVYVNGVTIPWYDAVFWAVQMALVGYCEESLFRGLLQNAVHRFFGENTLLGARLGVVIAGAVFGAVHLMNSLIPGVSLMSALIQAAGAAFVGMYLGAIYLRTGKCLWFVVAIHALNDAAATVGGGILNGSSMESVVELLGSMGPYAALWIMAVYGIPTVIILRKTKLRPVLDAMAYERAQA